jgi:hypothetical protein
MSWLQSLKYLYLSNNPLLWDLSYDFDYRNPEITKYWDNGWRITCWDYNLIGIHPPS